jgi:hypothetical protein
MQVELQQAIEALRQQECEPPLQEPMLVAVSAATTSTAVATMAATPFGIMDHQQQMSAGRQLATGPMATPTQSGTSAEVPWRIRSTEVPHVL